MHQNKLHIHRHFCIQKFKTPTLEKSELEELDVYQGKPSLLSSLIQLRAVEYGEKVFIHYQFPPQQPHSYTFKLTSLLRKSPSPVVTL